MKKSVRLADIGARLGVSTVTVSKALSGQKGVSDTLRKQIEELAESMGYVPPSKEPREAKNRSYTLGVLVGERYIDKYDSFYLQMYKQVTGRAIARECIAVMEPVSMETEKNNILPKLVEDNRADGIIVMGRLSWEYLDFLNENCSLPMIYLDFCDNKKEADAVISDSYYGAYRLTNYLFEMGHTRIGYVGTVLATGSITDRYMGYLMTLAKNSFRNVRVGLDCSNGSASAIAKSVFDALGAETYVINNEPNGTNINMEAGSTHIEVLQKYVKDNKLDIGFAYDGDADRCLCIDDKGNIVDGDLILYVCGVYMKQNGELDNNTVVTTIMSNIGLYKAFDAVGIDYAKTDVGDKYVYECMRNNNFRLGGEQSGHIIFSKYATTGDGILTSIKLMEVMLSTKKKMSELISPVVIYPQCLKNIRVESKPEARADVDVQAEVEKVAKLLGDDGRILVRESGTEPVIRVMVEAKTDHLAEKYVNQVIKVIEDKGHAV